MAAPGAVSSVDDDEQDDEPGFVTVELGPKFKNRIFHEFDNPDPGGEVLVVAGRRVKVRHTARVREALGAGVLVMSRKVATPKPPDMAEMLDQDKAFEGELAAAQRIADAAAAQQKLLAAAAAAEGTTNDGDPPVKPRASKKPE